MPQGERNEDEQEVARQTLSGDQSQSRVVLAE